jgi:phosphoglycolate phosphatase-like HAD superfamily hydrolase
LDGRDRKTALYVGDNIDDALAAKAAGVPFIAILSKKEPDYRERAKKFRELGALGQLERAKDLKEWLESRAVLVESEDSRNRTGGRESCL